MVSSEYGRPYMKVMQLYYSSARIIFYLALPGNKVRSLLYRGFKRNKRRVSGSAVMGVWISALQGLFQ